MSNNQNLSNKDRMPTYAQYEVENMKQEKGNTRTQQGRTEKLDRLIEAGALSVLSYSPTAWFAELGYSL